MSRSLCLTRECLGVMTRIECAIRPLADGHGQWTLLCAAGMNAAQPSLVRAQGPFCGPGVAEAILAAIAVQLLAQGYVVCLELPIWQLHMQAQLRRLNHQRGHYQGRYPLQPES